MVKELDGKRFLIHAMAFGNTDECILEIFVDGESTECLRFRGSVIAETSPEHIKVSITGIGK